MEVRRVEMGHGALAPQRPPDTFITTGWTQEDEELLGTKREGLRLTKQPGKRSWCYAFLPKTHEQT